MGVTTYSKTNRKNINQDSEFQHHRVAKQSNIYAPYIKKYLRVLDAVSFLNCEIEVKYVSE